MGLEFLVVLAERLVVVDQHDGLASSVEQGLFGVLVGAVTYLIVLRVRDDVLGDFDGSLALVAVNDCFGECCEALTEADTALDEGIALGVLQVLVMSEATAAVLGAELVDAASWSQLGLHGLVGVLGSDYGCVHGIGVVVHCVWILS